MIKALKGVMREGDSGRRQVMTAGAAGISVQAKTPAGRKVYGGQNSCC